MSRIPDFLASLEKMKEIHIKKNEDYATESNPFSNFDVSEFISSLFRSERDKAFAVLVGTKIGRLSSLLNSSRSPNNESIEDTFIDIANYFLLWKADFVRRKGLLRETFGPGQVTKPFTYFVPNEKGYWNEVNGLEKGEYRTNTDGNVIGYLDFLGNYHDFRLPLKVHEGEDPNDVIMKYLIAQFPAQLSNELKRNQSNQQTQNPKSKP